MRKMTKTARVWTAAIVLSITFAMHAHAAISPSYTTTLTLLNDSLRQRTDSMVAEIKQEVDSISKAHTQDSIQELAAAIDSINHLSKLKKNEIFVPDPKRALWLSLIIPGAGQIYNRKYWKLPIIYGGFIGCTYALLWNQQMYKDYSQAYIDIMDDDPNTASYEKMLPLGYSVQGKEEQFKNIFKHKKDYYRKYRDLSIFAFFGVYLLSVVDAYVDAQLSTFDISKDISMKFSPAIIEQNKYINRNKAVGLQCSINF